jgi:predicted N-acetyltransferase YhbS
MLAPLYRLPDATRYLARCGEAGIRIRRLEVWDRARLRAFVSEHFSEDWAEEAEFAFAGGHPITGFAAVARGEIVGFAVYESSRRGFFGPTGVRSDVRGNGVGAALLLQSLEAMREMGYGYAIIGWVGPADFYTRVCGATVIADSDLGVYGSNQDERAGREEHRGLGPAASER